MNISAYEKTQKVKAILFDGEKSISHEYEKRLIQIKESAKYIFELFMETDGKLGDVSSIERLRRLAFLGDESFSFHREMLGHHKRKIGFALSQLHSVDRAILAQSLAELIQTDESALDVSELLEISEPSSPAIAYVKNPQTSHAYDEFSSCFYDSRVLYARNFDEACEQMRRKNADYCILPLYSDEAGELSSVFRIIDTYTLKICAVYDYEGENGTVKYALISEKNNFILDGDTRFFDFSVNIEKPSDIQSLLCAAELFGFGLKNVKSTQLDTGTGCRLVLEQKDGDMHSLIVYLTLFFGDFNIYGFYSKI